MNNKVIDILLATYNGGKYIEQQIDSIINQTFSEWNLLFRDDGSTDNTVEIIKKYIAKYPERMQLIEDGERNLGPCGNFAKLLAASNAEYSMCCDQDDIWKENKVEITLAKMKEMEKTEQTDLPILIHTDLEVVDGDLNKIADSLFDFQRLNKDYVKINQLLVQNNVTGCTMMINRSLRELSLPIPKKVVMHDWWIGLVASTFGKIGFVNQSTIKYRQHGSNDVGAKKYSIDLLRRMKSFKKMYNVVEKNIVQAESFYNRYNQNMDQDTERLVSQYIRLLDYSAVKRLTVLSKSNFYKQGLGRNLGFKFIVATLKNKG